MTPLPANTSSPRTGWQRFKAASVRGFHAYANWLVGISWKRFVLLSVLLLILSGVLQNIPPFSWSYTRIVHLPEEVWEPPQPPAPPAAPAARPGPAADDPIGPQPQADPPSRPARSGKGVDISIDERGVRITPKADASRPALPASGASASAQVSQPVIDIQLPPDTSDAVREAVEDARRSVEDAVQEARREAEAARREAQQQAREAKREARRAAQEARRQVLREEVQLGESLPQLAFFWIVASLVIKITYRKQIQAEATAAQAVETAEAESLKRQVVEARMAAMQAQVEPHFLFNTLASIDHLIEVDPKRASLMQKNLIALLRASMPTMREASGSGAPRELAREMSVIRPYLEILKVRMEERLTVRIDVPDGLLSAEFPPMMVQGLVENAIKHGLEPKPEGGELAVRAEIVHGKLSVTVADTGLGFGKAATAGTGVGLANIRERLQLLYGNQASLTVSEPAGGGTAVTIAVPYRTVAGGATA